MTQNEFVAICISKTIDPALALESEIVRAAITQGIDAVQIALDEEF